MADARDLLHRLLDYIGEQAKDIDPRGYRLSAPKGYLRRRETLAGLPGLEFDIKVEGDHIWLRIPRLQANPPPVLSDSQKGLLRVSNDPDGHLPAVDEAAVLHRLNKAAEGKSPEERADMEARGRAGIAKVLEAYTGLLKAWAEGERPRRKTISLYGDLFALKHQLEAEETTNPKEQVRGIGVATWRPNEFEHLGWLTR